MFKVSSLAHLGFFKFPSSVASVQEVQVKRHADKFLNIISNRDIMDIFFSSGAQIPAKLNITFYIENSTHEFHKNSRTCVHTWEAQSVSAHPK